MIEKTRIVTTQNNPHSESHEYPRQLRSRFGSVETKLIYPDARQILVPRSRLMHRFENTDPSLTLVSAAAGYGKSMLVQQWLSETSLPSVWISLDRFDNDAVGFFSLLVEALLTIDNTMPRGTQHLLTHGNPPSAPVLARSLLADLKSSSSPFILVLDDYHLIENQEIHETISWMLDRSISPMHLIVISRNQPPLPLSRLQSRGELTQYFQEDLRFTVEESFELMTVSEGLAITASDAASINERAEGWVAGLRLVGHVLRDQSAEAIHTFAVDFSGSTRAIDSYLWEEVIDRQSAEVRTFLLCIAILDRFSASLCQVVSGNDNSAGIIRQLERDRLFVVSLDKQGRWFRFHHLFAAALRERLQVEANQSTINELHHRASSWFEDHDLLEEASRHAIAGEDWERAANLLKRIGAERFAMDNLETLCNWLDGIPHQALECNPDLTFRYAWALVRLGWLSRADQILGILENTWVSMGAFENLGAFLVLKAYRSIFIRPSRCAELAAEAVKHLSDAQRVEQAMAYCLEGYGHVYCGALPAAERAFGETRSRLEGTRRNWVQLTEQAVSAWVLIQRGRLDDAASLLETAIASADEHDEVANQTALMLLGEIRMEQLELDAATRCLQQAKDLCARRPSLILKPMIWESLAELSWTRNQVDKAFEEVDYAILVGEQMPASAHKSRSLALRARLWMASGQLTFAERWASNCELDLSQPPIPDWQYEYITLVRWFLISGELTKARSLIDAITNQANQEGQYGNLVEILLLRAVVLSRQGDVDAAIRELYLSLKLGHRGGFIRVFVNDLSLIQSLLSAETLQKHYGSYIRRIIQAASAIAPQPVQNRKHMDETLSRREIEVLQSLADGLSNREIGDRLYISDKTAKRHLSSIYRKLHVSNRVQAIERARQAKIIE